MRDSPEPGPQLKDAWEQQDPIPLNGTLERNGFPPLLTALLVPLFAFFLFQFGVLPLVLIPLLILGGEGGNLMEVFAEGFSGEYMGVLLTANSIGQLLGLALPAVLIARMHSARFGAFLRLRTVDPYLLVSAFLGWIGLYPIVMWLGSVNEQIPLPEPLRSLEQQQLELIDQVLMSDMGIGFNLLVLAIVPALCEEVLFRGYVLRQAERGVGVAGGILFSGIFFGLFHLRLTQVLPLCLLGIYLAYLVWRTGSLWPAFLVHFANNAFAVVAGAYAADNPEVNLENIEQMNISWYWPVLGLGLVAAIVYIMNRWAAHLQQSDAAQGTPRRSAP